MSSYNDELLFEHDLIESLIQNGWKDGVLKYPTEKDLINNWAQILFNNNRQIDRLGDYPLTDSEMQQIIEKINFLRTPNKINNFINGKTISIIRDNPRDLLHFGKEISLKIYDRQEIASGNSVYQIAEQPIFESKSSILNNRRGDLMLLINGMPLFHIELKRSKDELKQATNQIEKYAHEGIYSGIFQLVQIFVAMTPDETLYFANPGPDGVFNPSFYFHWEDFNNEIMENWKDITSSLLSIPMAHQLIGFYTVADDTDGILKVMRSYQYYAANKISDVVSKTDWSNPNQRGGFVWHTTGSGKTMTSFKSAQLIANSKDADKVVFLMDRIELGTQSLDEYQGFADDKNDVAGTEDTRELITKLKDDTNILIVTSIQKMSLIKKVVGEYTYDINQINKKRIVFIVDECHRSTFGTMMSNIKDMFPRAVFFGFTGTPVFDENKKQLSITPDIFGDELHRYVLADGIRDGNVLAFDLYKVQTFSDISLRQAVALEKSKSKNETEALSDPQKKKIYYHYINEVEMSSYIDDTGNIVKGIEDYIPNEQYDSDEHRTQVVKNIMDNWQRISRNNDFSAILATSSIPEAIKYYRLFKEKNAQELFKFTVLVDPNIDNEDGVLFKEDGLVEVISDYNKIYGQNYSLSTSYAFKKDVSNRLAHKRPYTNIQEKDKLGLLIVVNQMLTGFDSKWLNTLYLDKVLQYESVIQAFSRTNRVYKKSEKPFGIIKYYRKTYTMEKNIKKAVELYSGDKPFQMFVPKLDENIMDLTSKYREIEELFNSCGIKDFSSLPDEPEARKKFVKLFNDFNTTLNKAIIQGYVPKSEFDNGDEISGNDSEEIVYIDLERIKHEGDIASLTKYSPISVEKINALKSRYTDLERERRNTNENDDIAYDIESTLIEIDDGKIDADYINSRFTKYLKVLSQQNYSRKELDEALNSLHSSFATLSSEQQKYANIFLRDIDSGDITIDKNKSFMDYVTEYQVKYKNDQIREISIAFGLDESKLRTIMSTVVNENNIDAFGKFTDLLDTVDMNVAKVSLEKELNRELKLYEVHMYVDKILRRFILNGGGNWKEMIR